MIHMMTERINSAFQSNLRDWCAGGPLTNGWTRTGLPKKTPHVEIRSIIDRSELDVDEVLAKNPTQVHKWHIKFLRLYQRSANKSFWKGTQYHKEYLAPRYNDDECCKRALRFMDLFDDIQMSGVQRPVWVADVADLKLGFPYFRFDGCHRSSVCKVLGIHTINALLFRTSKSSPTH